MRDIRITTIFLGRVVSSIYISYTDNTRRRQQIDMHPDDLSFYAKRKKINSRSDKPERINL